jgi:hypothetical protein
MINVGFGWSSAITPTLAMVNVGLNITSIVGIALAVSGAGLYALRTVRPGLARDHDIFFAAIALLCGGIMFFQGWRQDPILQFGQFMLTGTAIWFAYEAIRLRSIATEQAKRSTPIVDNERPVSRVYRAELDDLTPLEDDRPIARRIRGTGEYRQAEDYGDDVRRRSSTRREQLPSSDRPRRRPSETRGASSTNAYNDYSETRNVWDDDSESAPPRDYGNYDNSATREDVRPPSARRSSDSTNRIKRPRPSSSPRRRPTTSSADYIDYQPIDYYEGESSDR